MEKDGAKERSVSGEDRQYSGTQAAGQVTSWMKGYCECGEENLQGI